MKTLSIWAGCKVVLLTSFLFRREKSSNRRCGYPFCHLGHREIWKRKGVGRTYPKLKFTGNLAEGGKGQKTQIGDFLLAAKVIRSRRGGVLLGASLIPVLQLLLISTKNITPSKVFIFLQILRILYKFYHPSLSLDPLYFHNGS